jgi:hypothetical protein
MLRESIKGIFPHPRRYQTFDTLLLTAKPQKRNTFFAINNALRER